MKRSVVGGVAFCFAAWTVPTSPRSFEVKKPSESKGPWDYYKLVSTIPGDQAFRPLDQGNCPMVAKKN